MCELLVRAVDKESTGNALVDSQKTGRGDVIVAMPDGHAWTPHEMSNPQWVVLRVPGMTLAEGRALTAEEPAPNPEMRGPHSRLLWRRWFLLDLDSLEVSPGRVATVNLAKLRAARSKKPTRTGQNIIG